MNVVPLALYFAAFIGYSLHFARRTPVSARLATTMLAAATLAHTFIIGMQTMEVGQVPVFDATSAISMFEPYRATTLRRCRPLSSRAGEAKKRPRPSNIFPGQPCRKRGEVTGHAGCCRKRASQ